MTAHKTDKIQWAKTHKLHSIKLLYNLTIQDFFLIVNNANQCVHQRPWEAFSKLCLQTEVQARRGSDMYLNCFSYIELGSFVEVRANLNQHTYIKIMDKQFMPLALHISDKGNI